MTYKVVLLGEGRVGKTSIGKRWNDGKFDPGTRSTVSAAFFQKIVRYGTKDLNIHLWDTAGQEEYHSLAPIYYKDAHAAILVFSVTDAKSFEKMIQWKKELTNNHDSIKTIVVANKIDLISQRVVTTEQGEKCAQQMDSPYYEVSAKSGEGIDNMMLHLVEILSTIPISNMGLSRRSHAAIIVSDNAPKEEKSSCC